MCSTPAVSEIPRTTHTIECPSPRPLGPVIGPFLTGLRDRRILGARTPDGRVLVPPLEWDPATGAGLEPAPVEAGPPGPAQTWAWVTRPARKRPLDHPFAFALVRLDGADTGLLHVVDGGSIER